MITNYMMDHTLNGMKMAILNVHIVLIMIVLMVGNWNIMKMEKRKENASIVMA